MNTNSNNMAKGKPFIKWVGGKGQLIEQLHFFQKILKIGRMLRI